MNKMSKSVRCTTSYKVVHWSVTCAAMIGLLAAQLPSASAADNKAAPRGPYAESNLSKARILGDTLTTPSIKVTLPAIAANEFKQLRDARSEFKRDVVGVGRELSGTQSKIAMSSLAWTSATNGTRFATLEFQSTDARAVRLSLAPHGLPKGITLYVYGKTSATVYGPYTATDLIAISDPYWLPVVEGDTVRVELQASAAADLDSSALNVPMVSHLVASLNGGWKNLNDLGMSGSCNQDIECIPPSSAAWITTGKSVAKYYVTTVYGATGACTGTLVSTNSGPSPSPNYFLTARHCIGSTADANSMHFYWFFQRVTCGGANPTTVTETVGGATLIKTVQTNDVTLVRLNNAPAAGTVTAPVSSTSLTAGSTVTVLHHPSGDVKKITVGTQQAFSNNNDIGTNPSGTHIRVLWNQSPGTTEPGSSGAAIFNAAGQIVGTLSGGQASCGTQTSPDWFGRLDQAYTSLQPWLSPGVGGPPPPDATPLTTLFSGTPMFGSVALDAQAWYTIQTQSGATSLTVTLTSLTADADVYVFRNVQDTSVVPSCFSEQLNTTNENCVVASPGAATWYIAVFGYQSASFTVTATAANSASVPAPAPHQGGGGAFNYAFIALLGALLALGELTKRTQVRAAQGARRR
jgi:hypothetical protein